MLAYMAAGDSLKLTSYTLGLSTTSIFRHRTTAMRKLGLRCLADVVRSFRSGADMPNAVPVTTQVARLTGIDPSILRNGDKSLWTRVAGHA